MPPFVYTQQVNEEPKNASLFFDLLFSMSAMSAKAATEPNSEFHMDVNMLAPMARKIPSVPYIVRRTRKGNAMESHLTI
ncbi:hypothetical protein CFE70_006250 [Pyrenophora teres f. teres 0-1]